MIQVVYQKQGGERQLSAQAESYSLAQIRELASAAGLLASVNGDAVTDDSVMLEDNDFVSFTEQVKGAAAKSKGTKKPVKKSGTKKMASKKKTIKTTIKK